MEGKLFVTSIFFEVIMSTLIFKNEIESIISFIESLSILSWKGPLNNQTIFLRTLSKHFLRCAEMPKDTIMPFRDMHKLEGSICKRKHLPCQKNKRKREEKKKRDSTSTKALLSIYTSMENGLLEEESQSTWVLCREKWRNVCLVSVGIGFKS